MRGYAAREGGAIRGSSYSLPQSKVGADRASVRKDSHSTKYSSLVYF
jgi:hypothetical protein